MSSFEKSLIIMVVFGTYFLYVWVSLSDSINMSGLKKLFTTTYNLGRALRPKPLPDVEVRLSDEFNKLKKSEKKEISKASLQAAFLSNKSKESQNGLVAQGR